MWMFKQLGGKEPVGLEGRTMDVGNVKIYVRNAIAEGGFSCVYIAQDAMQSSKEYALKHMICNDSESLDLVMKEISVMKVLKGHPNVVTLVAHTILDMGRRKEALLVMEICAKSLVTVLENRGAAYFEEKQILLIFRDVCNAVHAMHSQSPPIAHRDLKAENVLLGADGAWKICDFGSTSTNHKCFDKPEEMGIEEDNIRKHTTPAYRAPEMWDLFRREVISVKVDIWALGCLLYRICYLKSAFDGESKLQVLNGNYRIPDMPKYSPSLTCLIKEMLEDSPNTRPDIMQVWLHVNELLPVELRKHLPDGYSGALPMHHSVSNSQKQGVPQKHSIPKRSPPNPPPSQESDIHPFKSAQQDLKKGGAIGSFWTTEHAKVAAGSDQNVPSSDQPAKQAVPKLNQNNVTSKGGRQHVHLHQSCKSEQDSYEKSMRRDLEAEVDRLKAQLKQANLEKAEITSKHEKLSAICHSQQQDIEKLKHALAAVDTSPPSKDIHRRAAVLSEKIEGTVWELQEGMMTNPCPLNKSEPKPWNAFEEEPKVQTVPIPILSSGSTNGNQNVAERSRDLLSFNLESLVQSGSQVSWTSGQGTSSQRFDTRTTKKTGFDQPAGWAGF
ncbi:AP2-associated protein kinase 1-like [Zingiber officinale]|uniref:AP2-associated protein kinase 1-like n=1 Tax=Zingiber officinale TaxID=94328 RepID=UPI001C4BBC08|nr:AP2-associated protein kinase 1-like [Zingiber officinale]XP_042382639.1 AP2-associated protein kinase 1-like [Zingiber officinale]XP_042382640.1 AP2-associated protein kinase 1-like [Zingiber officinale]XP_042382642.1 AP2-associated protein kinase 1-like [Zingiber officinale]XP_042382643.1 AP2-associated protein kinase 1-like [Zingiber officinale]